jgi:methionine-S-sulfoxide reductase
MRSVIVSLLMGLSIWALAPVAGRLHAAKAETATFAGGCFWCMTPPFEKLEGVLKVTAGYTDGNGQKPTYGDYAEKGYTEGVQITFDPSKITYAQLVDVFWKQINPTDPEGQFVDRGPQYRAAIYYHDAVQKKTAEASKKALDRSGRYDKPIVTKILPYRNFFAAEDYHQDYYKKNPFQYDMYHAGSGRDRYLDKVWGKDNH